LNPAKKVRDAFVERLARFDFTHAQLQDRTLYEMLTLLYSLVGAKGYLAPIRPTCDSFEALLGEQTFYYARQTQEIPAALPDDSERVEAPLEPKMVVN
jgi:hypothetical protein